jgi:hypothetical protein
MVALSTSNIDNPETEVKERKQENSHHDVEATGSTDPGGID